MTKKVVYFLIINFVISTILMSLYKLVSPTVAFLMLTAVMWIPSISVFITAKILGFPLKGKYFLTWKRNRYVLIGVITPLVLALQILAINLLLPGTSLSVLGVYKDALANLNIDESLYVVIIMVQTIVNGLIAGVTVNFLAAMGEEIAWRGFLWKEFAYLGPWKASMVVGVIWGVWHLPLIIQGYNFPEHPYLGLLLMPIATIPLSVIMSYITARSGTITTAAFFHGVFNATAGVSIALVGGYTDIWHGPFGVVAIIVYSIVAYLIYLLDKKRQMKDVPTIPLQG